MKICEEKAKELFLEKYGSKVGYDFAGREMRYDFYSVDCEYGWNIDHILPESLNNIHDYYFLPESCCFPGHFPFSVCCRD